MQEVLNFVIDPSNRIYTGAVVVLLTLLALEVVTVIIGASLSAILDGIANFNPEFGFGKPDFNLSVDKPDLSIQKPEISISKPDVSKPDVSINGFMNWINAGHVPLLILIVAFLGGFAALGLTVKWIAHLIVPFQLPNLVVAPIVTVFTLPIVRNVSSIVGRLFPQDNTNAVSVDSLTGFYGSVVLGPATTDKPGQAKVRDDHGTVHYVRIVPEDQGAIEQGADVVLLERLDSDTFLVRKA